MGARLGPGLIPPANLWGRMVTTGPPTPDAALPFEERVERAWRRLRAGFQEDEHERLREVLGELIERERCGRKAR